MHRRLEILLRIIACASLFLLPITLFNGGPFRYEVIPQIVGISLATLIFYIIGAVTVLKLKFNSTIINNPLVKVGIGQLTAIFFIYIHSFFFNIGIPLKFNPVEFYILLIPILWIAWTSRIKLIEHLSLDLSSFPLLIASIVIIANRELPREIMLSSDPDQHFYFANQILRLGRVPFSQDYWGTTSFGYPSGLPVLSVVWSIFGFISIGDSITIQPLLQHIFAVSTVALLLNNQISKTRSEVTHLILAAVALVFWGLMPYPLQQGHYHLEGAGRLSSLFILTITPLLFIAGWRSLSQMNLFILGSISLAVCGYFNPINLFVPGSIFVSLWMLSVFKNRKLIFIPLAFLAVLLLDPYYFELITGVGSGPDIQKISNEPPLDFISTWQNSFLLFIDNPLELSAPLTGVFLERNFLYFYLPILFLTCLWLFILIKNRSLTFTNLLWIWVFPAWLILVELVVRPVFMAVRDRPKFYLLDPYFQGTLCQYFYLWFFACIGISIYLFLYQNRYLSYISVILLLIFGSEIQSLKSDSSTINMVPRYNYCGAMGCVTEDDKVVLSQIENQFRKYKSDGRPLGSKDIPKILTANSISAAGIEKWLIPWGGTRIAPSYDTFPFAFYYFQGSPEYSLENYKRKACKVDLEWLKERNIRFLFIPTEQADSCAFRIAAKTDPESIIYQSGKSLLLKLF